MLATESALRGTISAYALVSAEFGKDLGKRPLVLPNAQYFPDPFRKDEASAVALVRRMQEHAGMLDIPVETRVRKPWEADGEACFASSCGTGCSPRAAEAAGGGLLDTGDEWQLQLDASELQHPVGLTTRVAQLLATIFFVETRREDKQLDLEPALLVEHLAVGLGFGALLLEGSYVYSKSCGGPNVARLTRLGPEELALAVALFAKDDPRAFRAAKSLASTTQSAALSAAEDWVAANRELAAQLQHTPELLVGGNFELREPGSTGFAFWRKKPAEPLPAARPALPARRSEARPDDGLKELVEDVLAGRS